MSTKSNKENVYAYKGDRAREADIIHISKVPHSESGRGDGYYCLGCKRQMQAVKPTQVKSYFRHDAKINKGLPKCTYSDETYRHKLSKTILQGMKKIKVPRVYKFSPEDRKAKAFLIRDSEYIEAHTVLIEHYIFEDSKGEIQIDHGVKEPETKGLVIKPDVTFLDSYGKPILLIEIVATHKPKLEKLAKLKRLGIDAIQISIPKDSPENIERTFHTTRRTKWIYNGEEEKADYIQLSESHGDGVFEIDELQRKFFEENFKCRSSQIGELIRGIERILGAEHYKRLEGDFRSEIRRVEGNTERNRERLGQLRRKHGEIGASKHQERRGLLSRDQDKFQEYFRDLEGRYLGKRAELEDEETRIEDEIAEIEFKLQGLESRTEGIGYTIERERDAVERIRRDNEYLRLKLEGLPEKHRADEERVRERIGAEEELIRTKEEQVQRLIDTASETFEKDEERLARENDSYRAGLDEQIGNVREEQAKLEGQFEQDKERTIRKNEELGKEMVKEFIEGNYQGSRWFTSEYARLGGFKTALLVDKETRKFYERIREVDK